MDNLGFIRDVSGANLEQLKRLDSALLHAAAGCIKYGYRQHADQLILQGSAITKARAVELDDLARAKLEFFRDLAKISERAAR